MPAWGHRAYSPEYQRNRPRVMARDRRCRIAGPGCTTWATECDHIIPLMDGGTDALSNLQGLCATCHRAKSNTEAARARAKRTKRRAPRPHPNIIEPRGAEIVPTATRTPHLGRPVDNDPPPWG